MFREILLVTDSGVYRESAVAQTDEIARRTMRD